MPLGQPGWYLDQTLAGRDEGRYTVRRPDGTAAGTVRRSPVKGHWDASAERPGPRPAMTVLASTADQDGWTPAGRSTRGCSQ